jgi:alkylation response protein AidB-like acyl-CoA dehydrogenase
MIDFRPTEQQLAMKEAARRFAQHELKPVVTELEHLSDPWECFRRTREVYRKAAKMGLTRGFIPVEYGGLGLGTLDYAIAAEEMVKVDLGVPSTILANGLALAPLIYFGSAAQKRKWLTAYVEGQEAEDGPYLCTYGFTDIDGAANFDSLEPKAGFRTTARLEGDHYVINGAKYFATNGTGWERKGAWLYVMFCRTDTKKGAREGLSVILVPGNSPGISVGRVEDKLGIRLSVQPEVIFENVRVPRENLIGKEGDGILMMNRAYNWRGALLGIGGVGAMQAAFEYCLQFAKHDKRGGTKPIIHHQNVGFMLANMKMRIEAARYMVWRACHWVDTHQADGTEIPVLSKVFCSEIAADVCRDALYLMGVNGYVKSHPIERHLRDALGLPISDAGNMGVRRRQLHGLMLHPDYDPNAIVEDRLMPFDKLQASEV